MSVSPNDVRMIAPEFSALLDAEIQPFIDDASLLVSIDCFGNTADMAIKYLSAHLLSLSRRGSIGGEVTSKTVGSLSIGFSSSSDSDGFGVTSYGKVYQKLRSSRVLTMRTIC